MRLTELHEKFMNEARRPILETLSAGKLPVVKRQAEVPVVPVEKWRHVGSKGALSKTYRFLKSEQKLEFVKQILEHEAETGHQVTLLIEGEKVSLGLLTRGVDQVTEIDKEFAKYADEVFKDVVYGDDK